MKRMTVLIPNFRKRRGLVTVVAIDVTSHEVLMVAFTNREGFLETLRTARAVYYSTSRKKRWRKGDTTGNIQEVCRIKIDCDGDALIYYIKQTGNACHDNKRSCFYRSVLGSSLEKKNDEKIEILEVSDSIT